MKTISELRTIAGTFHTKPYGRHKYTFHLDGVHAIAVEFNLSEKVRRAAYGHDLREDTDITKEQVESDFGTDESVLIESVSGIGATREAMQQSIVDKLQALFQTNDPLAVEAVALKMCDRLFNMRHSLNEQNWKKLDMYCGEEPVYAPVFSKGPANLQAAINAIYDLRRNA